MARMSAMILDDDEESDTIAFMLDALGFDGTSIDLLFQEKTIEPEIIENHMNLLEAMVKGRGYRRAACFALGYLILTTGAKMSDELRDILMEAARWEHEKGFWDSKYFSRRREIVLKDFRDKIYHHKPGQKFHPIRLSFPRKAFSSKESFYICVGMTQFRKIREIKYFDLSGKIRAIKYLDLSGWNLAEIPKQVFELPKLEVLSMERNQIKGLPSEISNLHFLKELNLSYNQIPSIPDSLGTLKNLKALGLDNNNLKTLPDTIYNLVKLKYLYLRGNSLKIDEINLKKFKFIFDCDLI